MRLALKSVAGCSLALPAQEDTLWALHLKSTCGGLEDKWRTALQLGQEVGASCEQHGRMQPGLGSPRGHNLG